MSDRLRAFLATDDLDELLATSRRLDDLSKEDKEIVRSVLRSWDKPLAVSNLLFYPNLIPEDIRMNAILKGLTERVHPWYVLAAVVGLQRIALEDISEEERRLILDRLIHIMEAYKGVLSSRASVSVSSFLRVENAKRMLRYLSHPNEATRWNIMAWILRAYEKKGMAWFNETIESSGISQETKDYALGRLQQYREEVRASGHSTLASEIYSHILNLNQEVSAPKAMGEAFSEDAPVLRLMSPPD